jgi:hypothetical protein
MLKLLKALVLSLVMFTAIPLTQAGGPIIYPPVDTQPRAVEAFVSSERGVNVGTAVTILARVRGLNTNSFITGDELRLQMDVGGGRLAVGGTYTYTAASESSVVMDHICYSRVGGTTSGNLISRSSGSFGSVMIAAYGQPCATDFVDSGWYMAKFYAPLSIKRDQSVHLTVTDLTDTTFPRTTIQTVVVNRLVNHLAQVQFLPLSPNVVMGSDMPVILFASDEQGMGISCAPSGSGFESDVDSGCSAARNGYEVSGDNAININQSTLGRNSLGSLSMSGSDISGLKLLSRSSTTSKSAIPLSVSNLGGGAYMVVLRGGSTLGSGYATINAIDNGGVARFVPGIQLNTISRSWSL